MAIDFGMFLAAADVPIDRTRLVRHQARSDSGRSPYDLWSANNGELEVYQSYQNRPVYGDAEFIASFVATPLNETLFVGVYRVLGSDIVDSDARDPLTGRSVKGEIRYLLELSGSLADYAGRLAIDWGPGFRSWVQHAKRRAKPVLELRRHSYEPPFPGFNEFIWTIRRLDEIPVGWRTALAAVQGVYVLTAMSSGLKYVGSAYGEGGFWSRWEGYFRDGHGGNAEMKLLPGEDYQVAILEIASSSMQKADVERLEALWKTKLATRRFGLNRN